MAKEFTISDTFKLKVVTIKDIMVLSDVGYYKAQRLYSDIKKTYNKDTITMWHYIMYFCAD